MADVLTYLARITPSHAGKPNFRASLQACLQPIADVQNVIASLPAAFDLDDAVGVQLDAVGEWVGCSRNIPVPVPAPWFALNDPLHGLDRAPWYQEGIGSGSALQSLDDDTYRRLLRAKIAANSWDGTAGGAQTILASFFTFAGSNVFVEDTGRMRVLQCVSGQIPPIVDIALFQQWLIPLKSIGVAVDQFITSINGAPLFGLDVSSDLISGLDVGAWGVSPKAILEGSDDTVTLDSAVLWQHLNHTFALDITSPLYAGLDVAEWLIPPP